MGDTILRVKTIPVARRRVQRRDGLDADGHRGRVERLKHDRRHLLTVRLRVHRRLRQHDRPINRFNTEFVEERVVPDRLHTVPVVDDTVLNRVLHRQMPRLAIARSSSNFLIGPGMV